MEKEAAIDDQDIMGKYVLIADSWHIFCFYNIDFFLSTPLHLAAGEGHLEVVMALIDAEAASDMTNNFGQTPYDVAEQMNKVEVVEYLTNIWG